MNYNKVIFVGIRSNKTISERFSTFLQFICALTSSIVYVGFTNTLKAHVIISLREVFDINYFSKYNVRLKLL